MNILAVGAHFDDIELGCGATLKKMAEQGHIIYYFVGTTSGFTSAKTYAVVRSKTAAQSEGKKAAEMMGAILICGEASTFHLNYDSDLDTIITQLIEKYNIDCVFTHRNSDPHHDHWGLSMAVYHGAKHVKRILAYQSSWYDADVPFQPNFFVDISEYWNFKIKLLKCFESEYSRVGDKWLKFCETTASLYGLKNDCRYAEGFECVRWLA